MKLKRLLFLFLFAAFPSFAAYQQQGFSQFQELDGNMNFVCTGQCFALIGPMAGSDTISLVGALQGNGLIGYGFLVGQQIAPGETIQIHGDSTLAQQFSFDKLPFYSQLPKEAQVILMVQGPITGNHITATMGFMDVYQKIGQGWKSFRTFDTYKPYTINLLMGPMMLGKNANGFLYMLLILFVIIVFVFTKYSFQKKILYVLLGGLSLWLIYDLRMGLEMMQYYNHDYKTYISQSPYQKIYRDRGDFHGFVAFAEDTLLKLGLPKFNKVAFYTDNTWPFPGSMKYFLYPYDVQINSGQVDYYLVYGSQLAVKNKNHLVVSGFDLGSGTFYDFSPTAFIFVK